MNHTLIPVASGCPHNACAFCSMYRGVPYRPVPFPDVEDQLRYGSRYTERIFLTGADPMALGYSALKRILEAVRIHLPYCACVASYASIRSVARYSEQELAELHDLGLRLLYIGFESGCDAVLSAMNKGHTRREAIEQARKLNRARLQFNTIVVYGLAGAGDCADNACETASMINAFDTKAIITMNLRIFPGTPLAQLVQEGCFLPAGKKERLEELALLLQELTPQRVTLFDTSHPTNIIKIKGVLPDEKGRLMQTVRQQIRYESGEG